MRHTTINGNGNCGKELVQQVKDAHAAVEAARKKVLDITVHGRNYQLLPVQDQWSAFEKDRDERLQMLNELDNQCKTLRQWYAVLRKQLKG